MEVNLVKEVLLDHELNLKISIKYEPFYLLSIHSEKDQGQTTHSYLFPFSSRKF